jgi:hypothetical protein
MIGGENADERSVIAGKTELGRDRHSGSGAATDRLDHDLGLHVDRLQLIGDGETVFRAGDDNEPVKDSRVDRSFAVR